MSPVPPRSAIRIPRGSSVLRLRVPRAETEALAAAAPAEPRAGEAGTRAGVQELGERIRQRKERPGEERYDEQYADGREELRVEARGHG
jgi:hypothetical protein